MPYSELMSLIKAKKANIDKMVKEQKKRDDDAKKQRDKDNGRIIGAKGLAAVLREQNR